MSIHLRLVVFIAVLAGLVVLGTAAYCDSLPSPLPQPGSGGPPEGGGPPGGGGPAPTPTWTWQQKVDYWAAHQHDADGLNPTPADPGPVPDDIQAATGATTWDELYWWAKANASSAAGNLAPGALTAGSQAGPYQLAATPGPGKLPLGFPADAPGVPDEPTPPAVQP